LKIVQKKSLFSALAILAVGFGLLTLWCVSTQHSVPLGVILYNTDVNRDGVEIRDVSRLEHCMGHTPEVGDYVVQVAGQPVNSYVDWSRRHQELLSYQVDSGAVIQFGLDPSEENGNSEITVVEYPDKSRLVQVWFTREAGGQPLQVWLPLVPEPVFGVSLSLVWFILQLFVLIVSGLAYWTRPFDQPLRTFFVLSIVTLIAFLGGSHWWVIASNPILILMFSTAGVFLPSVLVHFFLVYPVPRELYHRHRQSLHWLVYSPAMIAAIVINSLIVSVWGLTMDWGAGPFASTIERIGGDLAAGLMAQLPKAISLFLAVAILYFGVAIVLLGQSLRSARSLLERYQVRSIFWAAMFAVLPIGYTASLAIVDRSGFALGDGRLPMYLASLAFMLAYGVGVAKYKLLLIDQVISRGVWYYSCTIGLGIVFAALVAGGAVNLLHQELSILGRTVPLMMVLTISVLVLVWFRDTIQRMLDQQFFSEKYRLDQAMQRMNRVVSSVLEPEAVSESLLNSCREVLNVDQAALYLRVKDRPEFRMSASSGRGDFPLQITVADEAIESLGSLSLLQRVPQGESGAQILIRNLGAEVIRGLEIQGNLSGILVLGAKANRAGLSAEDVTFLNAMARITSVALQCARVQKDVSRLNHDLQLKTERISAQDRQLTALQRELTSISKRNTVAKDELDGFDRGEIKGTSTAIQEVLDTARKVASSDASVLVRGESGTGKELLAQALHANSPRRDGPMVSVNCAALSSSLLESELFGHVKGAFTDAREDKIGRFAMAHSGTLFLDEIGDISPEVQVKLLRAIQERSFEPVGGTTSIAVDVRIVAATHRNLEQLIVEGTFREDLFYRLNVISVTLPPLRERKDDLFELAIHFMRESSSKQGRSMLELSDEAFQVMAQYSWPGNIRELQNVIERAVVLADGDSIRADDLPPSVRNNVTAPSRALPIEPSRVSIVRDPVLITHEQPEVTTSSVSRQSEPVLHEKEKLQLALEQSNGVKAEAARRLGMPRSTFFSKLKKHGIK